MKRFTVLKLASLMLASFVTLLPQQGLAQAKAKFTARSATSKPRPSRATRACSKWRNW